MSEREVSFVVYGQPVPEGSVRAFHGRIIHQNSVELKKYRKSIANKADEYHDVMFTENKNMGYEISVIFYMQRNSTVKRPLPTVKGKGSGDLDKLVRSVLDALTENVDKYKIKGLWADDSQVVRIKATKYFVDAEHPVAATYIKVRKVLLPIAMQTDGVGETFDNDV